MKVRRQRGIKVEFYSEKKTNFHDLQETGWILSYTRLVDIELYKTGGQQACTGNLLHDTIPQQ